MPPIKNTDRNAPCPCGSTKKFKHCCQRKGKPLVAKPHPHAAMVPVWQQLALQALQAGRLPQARALYEQILQVNPRNADALQWLGVVCHQQGNSERAIELISQAIAESPANAQFHSTLGNVLQATGQGDAAIASYRQALLIKPDFAEAHNNLGIALAAQGKLSEATECYRKAIFFQPRYAEAYNGLGIALDASGLLDEAVQAFKKALAIRPNYAKALLNLGNALAAHKPDEAAACLRQGLLVKPDFFLAWISLGNVLSHQGHMEQASASYQRALALEPANGIQVLDALKLPPIMGTQDEVAASRAGFESNLERLIAERITLLDPCKEHCNPNFHLAYHGLNDRETQQRVAQFYEQACPSLLYMAPHCTRTRNAGQKRRIGFLSKFITRHSVALSFSHIVQALAAQGEFEVVLISGKDPQETSVQETYPNFAGQQVRLANDLAQAREQVAALELDILVYLDIGMEAFSYFLAFARLARTQCVVGGHPVTTGISAVDYFLSSDLAEPADADRHYSEKLVRLPLGSFYFKRPALPAAFKTRHELGLPEQGRVYLCPMALHKLHPDFDAAMARILQLDADGQVVLFADKKYGHWQKLLQARFEKTVPQNVRGRIVFVPWITNPQDFISVNQAADVVLDPFHFGIGSTAIAVCSVGTPFITKPGEFMRGRVGLFYARIMDVMECVAQDCEDYAQKAVAIANDSALRQRIQSKILANNHALFENQQAILDSVEFFRNVSLAACVKPGA